MEKNYRVELDQIPYPIGQLMAMYHKETIQLPEIQRDVVWKIQKVVKLIESIYYKYPCGSLILWEPRREDEKLIENLLRPERLEQIKKHGSRVPRYLIIDGQQRLTALVSSLLEPDYLSRVESDLKVDWPYLFLDLRRLPEIEIETSGEYEEFRFPYAPLDKVFDGSIFEHSDFKRLPKEKQDQARQFHDDIRDYSFPVQIIKDCDYSRVAEIFYRVNTGGTELTAAEIHIAQIVPYWRGITKEFRKYLNELEMKYFKFNLTFLIRCLTAIATNGPKIEVFAKRIREKKISPDALSGYWKDCKNCINKAIEIVKRDGQLDKTKYLPSLNVFIPLVHYLYKAKKTNKNVNAKNMLKFFYYSQLGSHYGASTESKLKKDLQLIVNSKTVEEGLTLLSKDVENEARCEYRGLKVASDRVEGLPAKNELLLFMYIAMCQNGAKDFSLENPLKLERMHPEDIHLHHIFPFEFMMEDEILKECMLKNKIESRSTYKTLVNDIANLTFITKDVNSSIGSQSPHQYLENCCHDENLKAHFIPLDRELWKSINFDKFLRKRRELISEAVSKFIKAL